LTINKTNDIIYDKQDVLLIYSIIFYID